MEEQYNIQVWNRTDLAKLSDYIQLGVPNYKTFKTIANVPGLLDATDQNGNPNSAAQTYNGEVIPAYAVMKVAGPLEWINDQPTWPVCLPDDASQSAQFGAMHLFNGPVPIAFDGIGWATQTLPAQSLVDMTPANKQVPYMFAASLGQHAGSDQGTPLGILSGAWALHNWNDIASANQAIVNEWITKWPYTLMSYVPLRARDSKGNLQYTQPYAIVGGSCTTFIFGGSTNSAGFQNGLF